MKYFFMLILSISILICCSSCGSAPEPSEKFHNASQTKVTLYDEKYMFNFAAD